MSKQQAKTVREDTVKIEVSGEDGLWPWSKLEMAHSNIYRGEADDKTHVGAWMSDTLEEGAYHKLEPPGIL